MAASLIYQSPVAYELVMLALYRHYYGERHQAIADLIPPGSSVLELCCGPAVLYRRYLSQKQIAYRGLDLSHKFVDRLKRCGIEAEVRDLRSDMRLPRADYVIMQASLYHFMADASAMIDKMLRAARRQVIVAEPIRNLATARFAIVRYMAGRLADPGVGPQAIRFTEASLDALAARYGRRLRKSFLIAGGREKVCVFEAEPREFEGEDIRGP